MRQHFRLEWRGIHGVPHWGRVRWNGLAMARVNGAREDVVELFAFLTTASGSTTGLIASMVHGQRITRGISIARWGFRTSPTTRAIEVSH